CHWSYLPRVRAIIVKDSQQIQNTRDNDRHARMTGNAFLDLLLLGIPATLVYLWWTSSKARELAILHARRTCQQMQVQFLDQTVAISHVRLARSPQGQHCLKRSYTFEYTAYGDYRDTGTVTLHGYSLRNVDLPYLRDAHGNRIYIQ
ncbi:MAG: DUF3301 domain-containing protein, partial [Granulosicoccus sp.]